MVGDLGLQMMTRVRWKRRYGMVDRPLKYLGNSGLLALVEKVLWA